MLVIVSDWHLTDGSCGGTVSAGALEIFVHRVRELGSAGGVSVPAALRTGRPAPGAPSEPVPVKIHYVVGDHDWFFHLPEAKFDPLSFEGDRSTSSLSDAIVIELVNRFALEVQAHLANELPAGTVLGLREIDNLRPWVLIPVWIDGLLERSCPSPSMRNQVKRVWNRLVDEFLAIDFVRRRDAWGPADLVDGLRSALRLGNRPSSGWAHSAVRWLNELRGAPDGSYGHHALGEPDFRNRRAKHLVYGHTHVAESVPLDASYAEGYVLDQMYFNGGTWRRVYRPTQSAPAEHEFIASDAMTYMVRYPRLSSLRGFDPPHRSGDPEPCPRPIGFGIKPTRPRAPFPRTAC